MTGVQTCALPICFPVTIGAPVKLISGSGQQYYDAIKNEVIPFVETKYNTNNDRGLVGHSLGGLFTSHILFKDNGYFTRFGINSAALFFNNDESFKLEKNYFESKKQLVGKVFISAGGLEGDQMFVKRANKFANALRSRNYLGSASSITIGGRALLWLGVS